MQRKVLLCLSGAYRTTSTVKLQRLFRVIDLDKQIERKNLSKESRTELYNNELIENNFTVDYSEVRSKEFRWFILGHGPFRSYL